MVFANGGVADIIAGLPSDHTTILGGHNVLWVFGVALPTFLLLLGASLVLTALTMLVPVRDDDASAPTRFAKAMPFVAAPIGFLAGLVGIGGGIFLAPLLHLTRWRDARAIAATASLFILVNSLFGLAGQLAKNGPAMFGGAMVDALPLLIAVVNNGLDLMGVESYYQQVIKGGLIVAAVMLDQARHKKS